MEWVARSFAALFGSANERELAKVYPLVDRIGELEPAMARLSDRALAAKTEEFRARLGRGETLENLLPEAFAVVREGSKRVLGQRHFDVQLVGGIVLHQGRIAEMVTGEGKTLVATLPSYLNALEGKGVHVVTVNDYLARRDQEWMGPLHEFLGLTVGVIQQSDSDYERKKQAYLCDITYGTNNEFGFDYLRDNMKWRAEDQVQRPRHYAIVDEVDSILIDEARTPLIISGPSERNTDKYFKADQVARRLQEHEHFEIKLKESQAILSEDGILRAQELAGVESFYEDWRFMEWPHLLEQSLRAHHIFKRDVDYVVKDGEIVIVDEFTGRLMEGRRWSDGLHQAVEAKERIKIKSESQTYATITFQNYFRLYRKLAGMTGTALTEGAEFYRIYKLDVIVIPTNRPLVRKDHEDVVYRTAKEKYQAICDEIERMHATGRPLLVGTISIENSEKLSEMLGRRGIEHEVLNAKHHAREAQIVANAGQPGHVTIATNMAGRGTDIVLGRGVAEKGGLHIVGSERHEARRIDNQLRGRSGRQGDPGSSRFFLSLQDDLMRKFASDRVSSIMEKIGMKEGQEIEHPWVSKAIGRAQKKVEDYHFEIRRNLTEYDKVMNDQRQWIYDLRQRVLEADDIRSITLDICRDVVEQGIAEYMPERGDQDPAALGRWLQRKFAVDLSPQQIAAVPAEGLLEFLDAKVRAAYDGHESQIGAAALREVESYLLLNTIDTKWKEHLYAMDGLRSGIGLRGYAEKDPKVAYALEGAEMFRELLDRVKDEITDLLFKLRPAVAVAEEDLWGAQSAEHAEFRQEGDAQREAQQAAMDGAGAGERIEPIRRDQKKIGRNEPCPCGSGKKYKKCCGA
ncbi:MAG: preprotein translocase subunit SecA [Planctomycetes bacterium]|nr:preprotein translocase subunit SecA [Planctomycetota bacterium]